MVNRITWKRFFELNEMTAGDYESLPFDAKVLEPTYEAALRIAAVRQLAGAGMAMDRSARMVADCAAVSEFFDTRGAPMPSRTNNDYWFALAIQRNTGRMANPPPYAKGVFEDEFRSQEVFSGTLNEIHAKMLYWFDHDEHSYPGSDQSVIVMCNLSACDRRLRKRAALLGVAIEGNEFVPSASASF